MLHVCASLGAKHISVFDCGFVGIQCVFGLDHSLFNSTGKAIMA